MFHRLNYFIFLLSSFVVMNQLSCSQELPLILISAEHLLNCVTTGRVKQVSKNLNQLVNYYDMSCQEVAKIPVHVCTQQLMDYSKIEDSKNFVHLFTHNNREARLSALLLLGWVNDHTISLKTVIQSYRDIISPEKLQSTWRPDVSMLVYNPVALDLFCQSKFINMTDPTQGTTILMESFHNIDQIRTLINNPWLDINTVHSVHGGNVCSAFATKAAFGPTVHWDSAIECMQAVLEVPSINLNLLDNYGKTPLMYLAKSKTASPLLKFFLRFASVNVNTKSGRNGRTALMYAVLNNRLENVRLLLDRSDIDMFIEDNKGRSALTYAGKANTAIQQMLDFAAYGIASEPPHKKSCSR